MSISARLLYEDWADSIGKTYGDERLQKKFVRATNMAIDDLNYDSDLETNITHITSIDDDVEIGSTFSHIVYAGLSYFGAILGVRPADPKIATVVFNSNERMWERLKGQYARSIDNALAPTQSDTMENLGYLDD